MQVFIFRYKGHYCHGGYVCISDSITGAQKLLAKILKESSTFYEKQTIDQIIKEHFDYNKNEFLDFVASVPTTISNEMILLNSFDCA
jgi:hypothetical protein